MTEVILGLDPGSYRCGYGVLRAAQRPLYIQCGVLSLPKSATLNERLELLWSDLVELADEFRPAVVSVETAFVGDYPRAALVVAECRGVIKALALSRCIQLLEHAPAQVKKIATGRGNATKPEVRDAMVRLLRIPGTPALDASDAVAIALAGCAFSRRSSTCSRPAAATRSGR